MSLIVSAYAKIVARDYDFVREDRGAAEFVIKRDRRDRWPSDCAAFSIGENVFWPSRRQMRRVTLLRHELSHAEDYRRFGGLLHAALYWGSCVASGYENSYFEKKARAAERRRSR